MTGSRDENIYPEYNPRFSSLKPRYELRRFRGTLPKQFRDGATWLVSVHSSKQAAVRAMKVAKKQYVLSNWCVVKTEVVSVWPRQTRGY